MPLPDPASRARLAAMGIEVWSRRNPRKSAAAADGSTAPRVRLSSGDGRWLLVQRRPWDGEHAQLVSDITALLGAEQCRFGQWSGDGSAGQALSELSARGVSYVLAFGRLPSGPDFPWMIQAAELHELSVSAEARRSLWHSLRPCLAD